MLDEVKGAEGQIILFIDEMHTLIGAPPGYVGYDEGGVLTEAVRRRPYQVVLFDEVEKAHGDVFNVLLQVLDDGRLTDGQGRTVDFKNTLIAMTSNIGSEWIQKLSETGGTDVEIEMRVKDELKQHFRPEFLNRIDATIVFHSLTQEEIRQIVDLEMARVRQQLAEQDITLEIDVEAKDLLGNRGYDHTYGARPLRRIIQNLIEDPLAEGLLTGRFLPGHIVRITVEDDLLKLEEVQELAAV